MNSMTSTTGAPKRPPRLTEMKLRELGVIPPGKAVSAQTVIAQMRNNGLRFSDSDIRSDLLEMNEDRLVDNVGPPHIPRYQLTQLGEDRRKAFSARVAGAAKTEANRSLNDSKSSTDAVAPSGRGEGLLMLPALVAYEDADRKGPYLCSFRDCREVFSISGSWFRERGPYVSCPYCQRELELRETR